MKKQKLFHSNEEEVNRCVSEVCQEEVGLEGNAAGRKHETVYAEIYHTLTLILRMAQLSVFHAPWNLCVLLCDIRILP